MRKNKEQGFSLVEVLLVVAIVGMIAAMAVPAYQKGMWAAENGSAFANLRTIASTQVSFYTQHDRFGRLSEINAQLGNGLGVMVGDSLVRGRYVFTMTPPNPDDTELRSGYLITARRDIVGDVVYQYELTQTGRIIQVYPAGAPEN